MYQLLYRLIMRVKTIIDNIRTLLSLYYNNFEVIVVNDGSTDDTFDLIKESL